MVGSKGMIQTWLVCVTLAFTACSAIHKSGDTTAEPQAPSHEPPLSKAEYEVRRTRIAEYFQKRQTRYDVVATTRTKSGQVIDWIRPESQVAGGVIATPPEGTRPNLPERHVDNPSLETELPRALKDLARTEAQAATELQLDRSALGPSGTVPIVRFDLNTYFGVIKELPSDPTKPLTKLPPPEPESNDRYYAVWQHFGDVFGTIGRINVWDTDGPVGNETSIAQTAVIRGDPMQAIEAGKIETAGFSPSRQPVFFTYYRTSGAASGDWVGGYNADVDGWVQVSRTVAPGISIVPWSSRTGASQYSLDVEVRLWEGNWWVRAAGEWAGYYPHCKGGDATPCDEGTLFSEAGIRDKADRLDWYGEVFDESAPAATSTDMGSGAFAETQWQHAAYFRNLLYVWAPATAWWFDSGSISTTDNACYNADGPFYSSDANWMNWFYYGGPGKEAAGCR